MKYSESQKTCKNELEQEKLVKLLIIGQIDLKFTLKVTEKFLDQFSLEFDEIVELDDLSFLFKHKKIWEKIFITSNNEKINTALQINRASIQKIFVSYLSINTINFYDNNYKELVYTVAEQNFLFINEAHIEEECEWNTNLTFCLGCEGNFKYFPINKQIKKSNRKNTKKQESNIKEEIEEDSSEPEEKSKDKTKKNNSIHDNFLLKINLGEYKDFDFIYFDLKDFNDSSIHFNFKSLSNFYFNLKKSYEMEIITNLLNFEMDVNDGEQMAYLYNIFSLTSIYVFELERANKLFNSFFVYKVNEQEKLKSNQTSSINSPFRHSSHMKSKSLSKNKTTTNFKFPHLIQQDFLPYEITLDMKNTIDFFLNDILKNCPYSYYQKIALFLDKFNHSYVLQLIPSQRIKKIFDYDSKIYPKINHYNCNIVQDYQNIIKEKYSQYAQLFTNTFLGRIIYYFSNTTANTLYLGYLTSIESTKKILEIHKNNLLIPTKPEFYLVKIPFEKVNKLINEAKMKEKESNFTLDCVNASKSKLKYYNSLLDKNLNSYFRGTFFNNLKNKGFVNKKGYLFYDPKYREIFDEAPKTHRAEDLSDSVLYRCINNINIGDNISNKEVNIVEQAMNLNKVTNRRIPSSSKGLGLANTQRLFSSTYSSKFLSNNNNFMNNNSKWENNKKTFNLPRVKSSISVNEIFPNYKRNLTPKSNINFNKNKEHDIKKENE